jgi:hypothetical protein
MSLHINKGNNTLRRYIIVNIDAANAGVVTVITQTLLDIKVQIGPDIVTVGDFSTTLPSIDHQDKNSTEGWVWWHMLIIPVTCVVEIGRSCMRPA